MHWTVSTACRHRIVSISQLRYFSFQDHYMDEIVCTHHFTIRFNLTIEILLFSSRKERVSKLYNTDHFGRVSISQLRYFSFQVSYQFYSDTSLFRYTTSLRTTCFNLTIEILLFSSRQMEKAGLI